MRAISRSGRWLVATGVAATALLAAVTAGAQGTPTGHRGAAGVEVEIRNFAYHPSPLRIDRGTKVTFVNRDGAAHDATRRGSFGTGLLRPGEAATVRFAHRGTFPYVCSLHPGMRGKVVVG
jgi:plastocyanin